VRSNLFGGKIHVGNGREQEESAGQISDKFLSGSAGLSHRAWFAPRFVWDLNLRIIASQLPILRED
jgi:hypothetical protein